MAVSFCVLLLSLLPYVNPLVGTDAHGHTFPGATYPFGQIQLSPDTRPNPGDWDGCSGYHYSDKTIYGFSHTHLSGTGCDDWCDILIVPGGKPSRFGHDREKASPGYYEVWLDDTQVLARLAVGRRSALHEYTFSRNAELTLDLNHRDSLEDWAIEFEGKSCHGHRTSSSWAQHQQVHFYIEFDQPIAGKQVGDARASIRFRGKKLTLRVGISSVSWENARENLKSDWPKSLNALRKSTEKAWNAYLSKLESPYNDREHKTRFYTALYHTAIHPSLYSDSNGEYRGMDGAIHKADGWDRYTVFSLWDTFRGLHPLLAEIEPELTVDFIRSMLSIYDQAGKLPVWELSGWETNCMIGYNSAPVIADAIARGLQGFDYEKAFAALVASAHNPAFGMDSFRRNGLVLADDEHESVSKTLEYAFDDWCVAQVALRLGHMEEYEEFMTSAQYWKNVLDPQSLFMRPRLNGRWLTPFDPREVNNHYTEANSWQYSFFVPHDIDALAAALGGNQALEARLDALFSAPEKTTGRTQADITGQIGQYAHGNEPSHHIAYIYDAVGRPEKRRAIVDRILETLYSSAPDGLCGNEDCGQMSAWYVLSALGRYPVCPVLSSPTLPSSSSPTRSGILPIVTNPAFVMENDMFEDSLSVSILGEGTIHYSVEGGPEMVYEAPFVVREACELRAYSEKDGRKSFVTRSKVRKVLSDRALRLESRYLRSYSAGGDEGLIDGARGPLNWRTGGWQGYQDTDFVAVLDLKEERAITELGAGFLQDARSWIWMPTEVEYYVSNDGIAWAPAGKLICPIRTDDMTVQVWDAALPVACSTRYIRILARNLGVIPSWHPGAGGESIIFTDEFWYR